MTCCPEFERLMERGLAEHAQPHQLSGGTIITRSTPSISWSSARSRAVSPASITARSAAACYRANSGTGKKK